MARTAGVALLALALGTALPIDAAEKTAKSSLKSKPTAKKVKQKAAKLTKQRKPAAKKLASRSLGSKAFAANTGKASPLRPDRFQKRSKMPSRAQPRIAPSAEAAGTKLARADYLEPRVVETACRHDDRICAGNPDLTLPSEIELPRVAKTACRHDGRIFLMAACGPDGASAPLAANSNADDRQQQD